MMYRRFCEGLVDKGKFIPLDEDVYKYVTNPNKDYYWSLFYYTEEQYKLFQEKRTVSGITDTSTDLLFFDFDSEDNLEEAKKDTLVLCERLDKAGFDRQSIAIYFTGNKGFSVELNTTSKLSPSQFKTVTFNLAGDLKTFDRVINNPNRIVRIPFSKHQKSGLYKIPLLREQLIEYSIEQILEKAKGYNVNSDIEYSSTSIPSEVMKEQVIKLETVPIEHTVDFTKKPKGFSNCKWALVHGLFKKGNRSTAMMAIASTCKSLGFPEITAYYICKSAAKAQASRTGEKEYSKEEIWTNNIQVVYGKGWNGATYSCRTQPWLKEICDGLGADKCKYHDEVTVQANQVFDMFTKYANEYEKNIIPTGIKKLDDKNKFLVGTSNGILGPPGVGKTSIILSILNNTSKLDNNSLCMSYDMFHSMLCMRMLQKHTGYSQDEIFRMHKTDPKKFLQLQKTLESEYANVNFCFKSGQTPDDIERTIIETQESLGKKIRLVVIDYNELVQTGYSDPTQSSALVAQRLRQIANDHAVCIITLIQPTKHFSNPSDEFSSYQAVKGSSAIVQSLTSLLAMSRPGFSARKPEDDKFMTINCLKNRNGPLFSLDFIWDGITGSIRDMNDEEELELNHIRETKELEKDKNEW